MNLRPKIFNLHKPMSWEPNYRTAMRLLNRTIYRSPETCTPEQLFWLRNPPRKETELMTQLREKYGLIAYPDDLFYKTHKITHQDFFDKLEASDKPDAILEKLFDDESHKTGRRGVLSLKKAGQVIKKKIDKKEKMRVFAKKFTDQEMSNQEIKASGFMRRDMLY